MERLNFFIPCLNQRSRTWPATRAAHNDSRVLTRKGAGIQAPLRLPRGGLPSNGALGENRGGQKSHAKNDADSESNGLGCGQPQLAVLVGVPPVLEVELFTLEQDFSLFVVGSEDNVLNESTVTFLVELLLFRHEHSQELVVFHVLVARSAILVKRRAHGNNTLIIGVRGTDVVSISVAALSLRFLLLFLVVLHVLIVVIVLICGLCVLSSIARDAFPWDLEKIIVIVTVSKNLRESNCLSDVVGAVLVGKDTERDGEMVVSTVRADVELVSIRGLVGAALQEFKHIKCLHFTVVLVSAVGVVVAADVVIARFVDLFVLELAFVAHGSIVTLNHLSFVLLVVLIPDAVGTPESIALHLSLVLLVSLTLIPRAVFIVVPVSVLSTLVGFLVVLVSVLAVVSVVSVGIVSIVAVVGVVGVVVIVVTVVRQLPVASVVSVVAAAVVTVTVAGACAIATGSVVVSSCIVVSGISVRSVIHVV
mmetsp:Transcript_88811/g.133116  ORF Transcript_88811/g.133116 Transcript_88811/m.133116 type:complete len:478 (+) Transcript_88811:87-1520(+)